jgi:hypothetical protein
MTPLHAAHIDFAVEGAGAVSVSSGDESDRTGGLLRIVVRDVMDCYSTFGPAPMGFKGREMWRLAGRGAWRDVAGCLFRNRAFRNGWSRHVVTSRIHIDLACDSTFSLGDGFYTEVLHAQTPRTHQAPFRIDVDLSDIVWRVLLSHSPRQLCLRTKSPPKNSDRAT